MGKQLYTIYEKARLPGKAIPIYKTNKDNFIGKTKVINNLVLVRWPNGRPCHLINMWLTHICATTNATVTAKTYAAQISSFVRYCYRNQVSITEFTEHNFVAMKEFLVQETIVTPTGVRLARNNNQTIQIQKRTLDFLHWITDNHPEVSIFKLVGVKDTGANITVEVIFSKWNGRSYLYHPEIVSPVPYNDDKVPIDEETIQKLQNEIIRKHDVEHLPARSKLKSIKDIDLFTATNIYLYERRMCLIRTMKLMGLRPEELHELPLELNNNITRTKQITAPTRKRGDPSLVRRFKIDFPSARRFNQYLEARQEYIDFLQSKGIYCLQPNNFFIGENGKALKKSSITKEFDRLCEGAGLTSSRVCLSMFRHRFVTREINIRLEARFAKNPHLKNGWTPELRDSVCLEVAELTGHADPDSLYNYFYAEYKAITSVSSYSEKLRIRDELESSKEDLVDLEHQSKLRQINMTSELQSIRAHINELHSRLFGLG